MVISQNKSSLSKKLLLLTLFLFEVIILFIMESYKYYRNFNSNNFFSSEFASAFFKNFDFLYPGNLIWLVLFILSSAAILSLLINSHKIKDSIPKILFLFSIFLIAVLLLSLLLPSTDSEITAKLTQLNARVTKVISFSVFSVLHIFIVISLCVIAFSSLKKFYFFRSIWLTILVCIAGLIAVLICVYSYKDDQQIIASANMKLDGGVVLGAAVWGGNRPSPVLRERINKGYELLNSGVIKYIVLTGGGYSGEMTEAEVAKNELLKKGVDPKFILAENQSISTLEQITYVNKNIYRKNNWNKIAIITDNFHLFRSKQICNFFAMNSYTVASDTPLSAETGLNYSVKESFAVILFWLFGIG